MDVYIHQLTHYLYNHPNIGYWVTFLIAFSESIAIIGAIIPGSVTMTAIGVLIGSGVLPASLTLTSAVLGAFAGDFFSYWLGAHYHERLRQVWPFRHKPQWLTVGEDFFRKHGGKSVVFARFFGPVRSLIPLVAGMMRMSLSRFIIASVPSAAIWAMLYMLPGILVGALSLGLPKAVASKLILLMLGVVAFGWLIFVAIHLFLKYMGQYIDHIAQKSWTCLVALPRTSKITSLLSYPNCMNPHAQLIRIVAILLCAVAFLWLLISTYYYGGLTSLNDPLFIFFRSLRHPLLDRMMIWVAFMGQKEVLLPTAVCVAAWLMWRRAMRAGFAYLLVVVLGAGAVGVMKYVVYSPRPAGLLDGSVTSSFPSGHVVLAVIIFGFVAFLITRNMTRVFLRKWVYTATVSLVTLVTLSRLYLGDHWFTDVFASLVLGLALVLFGMIVYLSRPVKAVSPGVLLAVFLGIFVPIWGSYGWLHFAESEKQHTLYWPKVVVEEKDWWEGRVRNEQIPLFVVSRLGKIKEVLNVQWAGDLNDITENLIKEGWASHSVEIKFKETLQRLSANNDGTRAHLPLLPTLYQNKVPVRLFTRLDEKGNQITFMLWGSFVTLEGTHRQFWLGSVFYDVPEKVLRELPVKEAEALYSKATQSLISSLNRRFEFKKIVVAERDQPSILHLVHWGRELLLIKER